MRLDKLRDGFVPYPLVIGLPGNETESDGSRCLGMFRWRGRLGMTEIGGKRGKNQQHAEPGHEGGCAKEDRAGDAPTGAKLSRHVAGYTQSGRLLQKTLERVDVMDNAVLRRSIRDIAFLIDKCGMLGLNHSAVQS